MRSNPSVTIPRTYVALAPAHSQDDSGGGTLYRVEGRNCTRIASDLTPLAFVATPDALFTWDAKTRKPVAHVTR